MGERTRSLGLRVRVVYFMFSICLTVGVSNVTPTGNLHLCVKNVKTDNIPSFFFFYQTLTTITLNPLPPLEMEGEEEVGEERGEAG